MIESSGIAAPQNVGVFERTVSVTHPAYPGKTFGSLQVQFPLSRYVQEEMELVDCVIHALAALGASELMVGSEKQRRCDAEALMHAESARFKNLFENAPVGLWEGDFTLLTEWFHTLRASGVADLREYLGANPAWVEQALLMIRIRNVNTTAAVQNGFLTVPELVAGLPSLFTDRTRSEFVNQLVALFNGETFLTWEGHSRKADGTPLDLVVGLSVPAVAGVPDYGHVIVAGTELGPVRANEESMKASAIQFRALVEAIPEVFCLIALDPHEVLYVSARFKPLFGFSSSKLFDSPEAWLSVIASDDGEFVRAAYSSVVSGQREGYDLEYRIRRSEGETCWVRDRVSRLHWSDGRRRIVCRIIEDITNERRREEERREMEQRQQQSQRLESLGVLAGGIAHDFNNILTAIIGNLDLAVFSGNLTPHDQESVDAALQAARRAQALVAQTLMFSRQRQVERVPMHLSRVIREVVRLLRASIPSCIEIVHCACSPEPLILGDPAQMHQVLLNLGTNAAQAIGDCEGRIEIWANMEHLDPEAASRVGLAAGWVVRLVVSDSGCGMDEETIQRMFEPFFTTKPLTQGTGIGLSVVHGIVKGHHGVFSVESAVGKGTRISVYFPVHHGELQRSGAGSGRAFTGAGQRVLVVDDSHRSRL
jgi:PAS domain S-box-containing protein